MKKPPSIYRSPWGHNIILADLTIIMLGHNNNDMGLQGYNNNNKGGYNNIIRDYTINIGT